MRLTDQIVELHTALEQAGVPHAFGGALALAWCTQQARGTIDIDVNLFVDTTNADTVLDALPEAVVVTAADRNRIGRDGQTRLWWDTTPVDVFFNTTAFHAEAAGRVRFEAFAGARSRSSPATISPCSKRSSTAPGTGPTSKPCTTPAPSHVPTVLGVLATYLGGSDPRIERLRQLAGLT